MTILDVTRLRQDGRGVGSDSQGKAIFIDGVIPGERVTYEIKAKKRRFNEARIVEVVSPSLERVVPKCEYFLTCGGCAQQHLSHSAQLQAKQQGVLDQLLNFSKVKPQNILDPLIAPIWGYRTKARLGVKYVFKKEKILVGFRERNKSYVADIDSCEILHPKVSLLISPLKIFLRGLDGYQNIVQIEVAVGDDKVALIFRNLEPLSIDDQQQLINFAKLNSFDFYLQPAGPESITKVWPNDESERLFYSLPEYNLKLNFYPLDFTQINPYLNRKMIKQALNLLQLEPHDKILDLFCGLGNFTLPMATIAQTVTGIEGSAAMVERGYENSHLNNLSNVDFIAADLFVDQSSAIWAQKNYTKVLLDPPRSGALEVLPLIDKLGAKMVLYVSCNPVTLARDSGILTSEYGYTLQDIGIMDMFPHTMHVEAMALFVR